MKRALAIVDFEPARRGGHFREWSAIIARAASQSVDCVGVYVADFDSIPIEISNTPYDSRTTADIFLFDLETVLPAYLQGAPNASKLSYIATHLVDCSRCDSAAAFVLWAFDLSMQNIPSPVPWGGIGVLSAWARHVSTDSTPLESDLYSFARKDRHCRALLVWDKFVSEMNLISRDSRPREAESKVYYLPDLEEVSISACDYVPRGGPLTVGLVGVLWGYRGVNLLAGILEHNEDMQGLIAGQPKPESYSTSADDLLAKGRIGLGETERRMSNAEFNEAIAELDALVLDARAYPPPSGVALRALACGRCLIASEGPSWTNDVIARYQCGLIVDPSRLNGLSERVRLFYESGGSERCIRAARDLMNQDEFAQCVGQAIGRLFDSDS
jgi:glycosyltransferase involved in cell wall biosynthesis